MKKNQNGTFLKDNWVNALVTSAYFGLVFFDLSLFSLGLILGFKIKRIHSFFSLSLSL